MPNGKMGPSRSNEWTCCFGIHVRTATVMIGMWHLFLNVLTLGILAAIIRNPYMMKEFENGHDDYDVRLETLPTPLLYRDYSLNYQKVDLGCICMIAISLMLIYGSIKYKPSHLLPFFCLQLFDFAITTLTAAGYLCYLRSIHRREPSVLNFKVLPDYEETLSQSMKKQPPPSYYKIAIMPNQLVPNLNTNENQSMHLMKKMKIVHLLHRKFLWPQLVQNLILHGATKDRKINIRETKNAFLPLLLHFNVEKCNVLVVIFILNRKFMSRFHTPPHNMNLLRLLILYFNSNDSFAAEKIINYVFRNRFF
ncbi:uncharacterized protein LOC116351645 [Contarinia nasturtii]|uniref:uncharacterized protein LOC116351645 n=1 Tax=Contarinia nasturtii TaxID=265458 RepID=UPI0012D4C101|nr:uncharacterized protein LOC116351645 [Contarinia nasturtii]